jgi:hypothetical protein
MLGLRAASWLVFASLSAEALSLSLSAPQLRMGAVHSYEPPALLRVRMQQEPELNEASDASPAANAPEAANAPGGETAGQADGDSLSAKLGSIGPLAIPLVAGLVGSLNLIGNILQGNAPAPWDV